MRIDEGKGGIPRQRDTLPRRRKAGIRWPLRQDDPPRRTGPDRGDIDMAAQELSDEGGEAALKVHHNKAEGKIGVLCLAPEAGLGITDPAKREAIGEDKITLYQRHARGEL